MSLKSFSFGSLTVLATLFLAVAPISFSELYFLESVSAQTTSDRKAEAYRLLAQGNKLYQASRYREAIQSLESALKIYRDIKNRSGEAISILLLGEAYRNLGQYQKAIDFFQQSLAIFKQIGNRNNEATSLSNLGNAYTSLGQYQKAIDFFQQSLAIFRQIGDRNSEATSLNNLGSAYNNLGQYQKAIDFYQQSLAIKREIGDRNGEATSLNNLGSAYNDFGQYQKAIDFYQQSLAIFMQIGDLSSEAVTLSNLGNVHITLGQYQKAIEFFQQSLAIFRQIGNRNGEAVSLGSLGEAYRNLGQYLKAIDFFQQSLAIFKQIGARNSEAASLNNLGSAYNNLEQYQKAIDFYQQSLAIFKQIGDRNGEATSLNNLGGAYNYLGQYQKAIDFSQQSLAIRKQIGDRNGEATSLNNLGFAYNDFGQYQKAIDFFQQSLVIFKQIGNRNGEGASLNNLGLLFKELKQPELAILFYKQSVNIIETIRKDIKGLSQTEQKSYLATVEKTYRNLADLLLKQDRILEAQQILDLLKVQELSDYFRSADVGDSAKQADYQPPEQNIIALGNELAKLQQLDTLTKEQEQRLAYLTNQESNLNKQFDAFLKSPAVKEQLAKLAKAEAENVNIEVYKTLRAKLNEIKNAAFFYPLILEDRLELILITANSAPIRKTVNIKRENLNKDISDFLSNLRDPSSTDVKTDALKFYNYLIKPFEKELKDADIQTIIYSPDGQLRYIPIAALHDGKQWLIEKYRINNITAISLTNFNLRTYKPPRVLAAAATNSQNIKLGDRTIPFGALPATKTEVEAIAALLPNTTTLIDQQFNKADTKNMMNRNTIVHLATHGYFAIGKPEDSFIVFGDGDKATITDIGEWTLTNVNLVILSACETAIGGKLGNGIETLGIGYQIHKQGAGAAIASLWKVSDNGTSELMQALYKKLSQKNISSSEALRQAQITMIRSDKKGNSSDRGTGIRIVGTVPTNQETQLSHPFYWSAFILIGNGL